MSKNVLMNFSAKSGAYIGAGFIIVYLLTHLLHGSLHTTADFSGNVNVILLIGGIVFSTRKYRGSKPYFSYPEAFKVGFLTAVFASVIGAFFLYLYYNFIQPQAIEQYLILQQNMFLASGMADDQTALMTDLMKGVMTPGMLSFSSFFGNVVLGLIISLITALFLKKGTSNPDAFNRTMSQIDDKK